MGLKDKISFNTPGRLGRGGISSNPAVLFVLFFLFFMALCSALLAVWFILSPVKSRQVISSLRVSSRSFLQRSFGIHADPLVFLSRNPKVNLLDPERSRKFRGYVNQVAKEHEIPPEMVWAVIRVESNFKVDAVSRAGAIGLMQLHPDTLPELGITDPEDPYENVAGGTRYLKRMFVEFRGDWRLALAAYNAGPNEVKRYGGIPPYPETINFVSKVMEEYKIETAQKQLM